MIQANELRIGNWFDPVVGDRQQVNSITVQEVQDGPIILVNSFLIDHINPIPLTPEILQQYGFQKWAGGLSLDAWNNERDATQMCRIDVDYVDGEIRFKSRYESNEYSRPLPNIKYLHQFQNLYFIFTESEIHPVLF